MGKGRLHLILFLIAIAACVLSGCRNNPVEPVETDRMIAEKIAEKPDLQQTEPVAVEEKPGQPPEIFVQMFENHPLHRDGALSPDDRYYAYEERSSVILVRLPTAEEYASNRTTIPKVLFTDGRREENSFVELETDYVRRLQKPLLTEEERQEAEGRLRSVYDWNNFYYLTYSQDGRYLAYLGYSGFGDERTCAVHVVDIEDGCKPYTMPVKEEGEYAEISWQADNQTLELYLPWAEKIEEGYLALRRRWHIPSGRTQTVYYTQDGAGGGEELASVAAEKAIADYAQKEAERERTAETVARLTVEERVAALTAEQLAAEYARYFSLVPEQEKELRERGYSEEVIAGMDRLDFQQEEEGWLLSEQSIRLTRDLYPELEDEDLSEWTYKDLAYYTHQLRKYQNDPPEALKQEIIERRLPADLTWEVAKEFHGWESMLSYTNEAIIAMYEAVRQTNAQFSKEEAYRLAVRAAYLAGKEVSAE